MTLKLKQKRDSSFYKRTYLLNIIYKTLCIETVYSFIQSEMTSVHTISVDTYLLIFNNGLTCYILKTWFEKTVLYKYWRRVKICSTENVMGRW